MGSESNFSQFDVIVIGGGLNGLLSACALGKNNFKVAVIEKKNIFEIKTNLSDGRTSAIANKCMKIMEKYGLGDMLYPHAGPIEKINITDNYSSLFLHFDNKMVDGEPLGFMLANHITQNAMLQLCEDLENVTLFSPSSYKDIVSKNDYVEVELDNGTKLRASLLIAADGKFSPVREKFEITTKRWDYHQNAMIFNVSHEKNHNNIAQEMFLPSGPFAILPLKGGYESAVVWTENTDIAKLYLKMNDDEFMEHLSTKFTPFLGKIVLTSKVSSYPLSVTYTGNYYHGRIALVGDSAHSIHPLAGQGFNLGVKDIDSLVTLLINQRELGLDIGGKMMLSQYQNDRRRSNKHMLVITDLLNKLFSNNMLSLKIARRIGISTVNKLPRLKKFFMNYAMGNS
jgi:2-octaprenyl-6-methoxyphenol hydroxylase